MVDNYEKIIQYVESEMPAPEREDFERRLSTEPELAQATQLYAALKQSVSARLQNEHSEEKLRESLKMVSRDFFKSSGTASADAPVLPIRKIPQQRRWWMAAAATIVFLLASWVLWDRFGQRDLYAQFRTFPSAAFTSKASADTPQSLQEIEAAFNAGHYAAASTALEAYLAQHPDFLEGKFYYALCQLELGQTPAAIADLDALSKGNTGFSEDATWFLALAFLQQKNYSACRKTLNEFAATSDYRSRADKLLLKLEKYQ